MRMVLGVAFNAHQVCTFIGCSPYALVLCDGGGQSPVLHAMAPETPSETSTHQLFMHCSQHQCGPPL